MAVESVLLDPNPDDALNQRVVQFRNDRAAFEREAATVARRRAALRPHEGVPAASAAPTRPRVA